MGRVNQLWQDERERLAEALVAAGADEEEAWELAASPASADTRRRAETTLAGSGRSPSGAVPAKQGDAQ